MKNLLLILFTITFLTSCVNEPKSIGMTNWSDDGKEYKFHLGTEEAIDVVRKYDELLTAKDWEGALELFADTATVTYHNGVKVSPSNMLEMARVRDSNYVANNVDYSWTLQGAFSVDLDPSRGGEHVNANYLMNYDDGENTAAVNAILRFYVIEDIDQFKVFKNLNPTNEKLTPLRILKHMHDKKEFQSDFISEEDIKYLKENISEYFFEKGEMVMNEHNISDIVFLRKNG